MPVIHEEEVEAHALAEQEGKPEPCSGIEEMIRTFYIRIFAGVVLREIPLAGIQCMLENVQKFLRKCDRFSKKRMEKRVGSLVA